MATKKKSEPQFERGSSIFDAREIKSKSLEDLRDSYFKDLIPEPVSSTPAARLRQLFRSFSSSFLFKNRKNVAVTTAIATFALSLSFSSLFAPNQLDTTTLAAKISGGVALTEPQLREVVKSLKQTVYWAGPVAGNKYTINAQNINTIYVRYLPNGEGISDQSPKYQVVATYKQANAYDATLTAGNQTDGVSIAKNNGAVLYYNKKVPTNVYVAFEEVPYQVEIFNEKAETSLQIANSNDRIQVIK